MSNWFRNYLFINIFFSLFLFINFQSFYFLLTVVSLSIILLYTFTFIIDLLLMICWNIIGCMFQIFIIFSCRFYFSEITLRTCPIIASIDSFLLQISITGFLICRLSSVFIYRFPLMMKIVILIIFLKTLLVHKVFLFIWLNIIFFIHSPFIIFCFIRPSTLNFLLPFLLVLFFQIIVIAFISRLIIISSSINTFLFIICLFIEILLGLYLVISRLHFLLVSWLLLSTGIRLLLVDRSID